MTDLRYAAFEVPDGMEIDRYVIGRVVARYLQGLDQGKDQLTQYVGEYEQRRGDFLKTNPGAEQWIEDNVFEELRNRYKENLEQRKISMQKSRNRRARRDSESLMQTELDGENKSRDLQATINERLSNPYFRMMGSGQNWYYEGINTTDGDILKLRGVTKIGKDGNGTYLYSGYLSNSFKRESHEVLKGRPEGYYVCFETKKRLEDVASRGNPEEVRQMLALLSFPREYQLNGKTLNYIGSLEGDGSITRNQRSNSPAIQTQIDAMRRTYEREEKDELEY